MFVPPYALLTAAIAAGNLDHVRALVAEGVTVRLDDAARILALIAAEEPDNFERAAVRWMARYVAEKATTLDDVGAALDALTEMPMELPALLARVG